MRWQSDGNQMAIRWQSASPRTQCFIDVLEEALAFGHVIARVVARLPRHRGGHVTGVATSLHGWSHACHRGNRESFGSNPDGTQRALRVQSESNRRSIRGHHLQWREEPRELWKRSVGRTLIEGRLSDATVERGREIGGRSGAQSEGTQRVLRGRSEGTQRAIRGQSEGAQRVLRGQSEGT